MYDMERSYFFGFFAVMALLASVPSTAWAAPATGEAQVVIVTPLTFINNENLDFGRIIPANIAGTVSISETNTRTATNGIVPVGNDYQAARFAGMGAQDQRVRIRISPTVISLIGPGPAMTVDIFAVGPEASLAQIGNSPNYRIVPTDGVFQFAVAARLHVGANQPAGTYSGSFSATLDYQ